MHTISMILAYFLCNKGSWPEYIDWHLASCEANDTVDFFIFTDDRSLSKWENVKNIHFIYMSFEECVKLMKQKLGDVQIDTPYKMCDYKPAYGVIFEDYISKYDFWGHYDCDLIYGNIRHYFTKEKLDNYDKLMILGHTSIYRNNDEAKHFYCLERPKDSKYKDYTWKKVSSSTEHFGYDEWSGVPQLVRENGKKILWDRESFVNTYEQKVYKKVFDKNVKFNKPFQVWHWKEGSLYHKDTFTGKERERFYIHLTQRKMKVKDYVGQKEVYITQKSEIKDSLSFGDGFAGIEFVMLFGKKIFQWMIWKLTHLSGKKAWEM